MKKILLFFIFSVSANEKLTLGTPEELRTLPIIEKLEENLRTVFSKLNIDLEYVYFPTERSINLVNSGSLDGDFPRVKERIENYKNIFYVDAPILSQKIYVYSLELSKTISWNELEKSKIGTLFGAVAIKNSLDEHLDKYNLQEGKTIESLEKLLLAHRVDYLVLPELIGEKLPSMKKSGKIKKSLNPIDEMDFYLLLNNKHKDLKKKIENEINLINKK